jgi:predicted P-loop ATPase
MTQASVSKIGTFDQDDLNKTIEKAKNEALEMASLEKEAKCEQILDRSASQVSIENFVQQIKHEPIPRQMSIVFEQFLGVQIRFIELTQEIEIFGDSIKAYDFDTAEHWVDERFGIMGTKCHAQSALKKAANRNRYHPVREYLDHVSETDESIDLDLVAEKVLGLHDPLSKALVNAWLCGAVSKVYSPEGSPFIEVLTLISPKQGIGKSEFFKSLASPKWFSDSFAQTDGDKDRILCLHRSWINEISELDQFSSKKDIKQLKGLISTTTDTIRLPYASAMENKPRQFVIGATSNSRGLFAIDDEQRRFWAMEVQPTTSCGRLDIQWLREKRDAIWATATRCFKEKGSESFQLSKELRQEVIDRNASQYQQESFLRDKITQYLEENNIKSITVPEALEDICGISSPKQNQLNEVGALLREQGYQKHENQMKLGKKCRTLWINSQREVEYSSNQDY